MQMAAGMAATMLGLSAGRRRREAARAWHNQIQKLARDPDLFANGLAQDTLDGRFEMLTLVSTLVLRRLRELEKPGRKLADSVYRDIFSGFDHALREEGVGDASIARKVRGLGERFFGLARAVDGALGATDKTSMLTGVIERNGLAGPQASEQLSIWLVDLASQLDAADPTDLLIGRL